MKEQFRIRWVDRYREPQVPFNRAYPWGKAISAPERTACCKVELPWPAPRCGFWRVQCTHCDTITAITAAGRVDDPVSAHIPCAKRTKQ